MIKNITLGQYFPGNSVIHRMDPRAKFLIAMMLIVIIFVVQTYIGYLSIVALLIAAILLSHTSFRQILKSIRPLWFILILTFVLNIFFMEGETVLWSWWRITVTLEGIIQAAKIALRLILLITSTSILTLTTSPMEITVAMESLLKPLKVIHFPVHEIALMMSIALRFIPTLLDETDRIMKAQTARGASFDTGSLLSRAKGLIPILVPLFVSAFKRADELALAMEARCYNGGENKTRMHQLKLQAKDFIAMGVSALLILVACFGF